MFRYDHRNCIPMFIEPVSSRDVAKVVADVADKEEDIEDVEEREGSKRYEI